MNVDKKQIEIKGKKIAYLDYGEGDVILMLHGNPSSSHLWRNIAPTLSEIGRVVIPDLIGMGDSEKLEGENNPGYSFNGHYEFLDEFCSELNLDNIHLVIHDWGSALGFRLAREHSEKIKSISFMEAIVRPMSWEEWPEAGTKIFKLFRSEAGEELVLEKNFFLERILLADPINPMSEEDKEVYRKPFLKAGEDRRPTLTWPRNIPLDGEPADTFKEIQLNADFHQESEIPKLFINAEPGFLLTGAQREFARSWKNLQEITVKGNHFIQEDSPQEISEAISKFISSLS